MSDTNADTDLHADWDRVVLKFAEMASKGLGIVGVAHIEAWLQHITLRSKTGAYQFVSESQAPQDHFATMVVLLVPTNTVCPIMSGWQLWTTNPAPPIHTNMYCCHGWCRKKL